MKKYILTGALVTIIATTIYAQTTGTSSIITKMKAAAANFTLTELIPTGQTGLTSAPLVAKKQEISSQQGNIIDYWN